MATKKKAKRGAVKLVFTRKEGERLVRFINNTPLHACLNPTVVFEENEMTRNTAKETIDWILYRKLVRQVGDL